ncbi:hypothetical protein BGZ93_007246 [Podila epicladia]|nr:hypothetical protein BGZ93_007246 [Podila epicladia]
MASFLIHKDDHHEAPKLLEAVAVPVEVPVEALRDTRVPEKILQDDRVGSWMIERNLLGIEGSAGVSQAAVVL